MLHVLFTRLNTTAKQYGESAHALAHVSSEMRLGSMTPPATKWPNAASRGGGIAEFEGNGEGNMMIDSCLVYVVVTVYRSLNNIK